MSKYISFNCPACRKRLKVNRQLISKRLQCSRCQDIFYLKKVTREEFLQYEMQFRNEEASSSIHEIDDSRIFDDFADHDLVNES